MMLILAVDTTTPNGSAALLDGPRLLAETAVASAPTHSAVLLRSIDHILAVRGATARDIEAFAVAAGPGSFTGIRIGLSTVKALAFASNKPAAAVSSLRALSLKAAADEGAWIAPMLDARKGEIYAALFEASAEDAAAAVPEDAWIPGDFLSRIPDQGAVTFIGDGLDVCREDVHSRLGNRACFLTRTPFIAHEVGLLAARIFARNAGAVLDELEPLYYRRSQAEEKHHGGTGNRRGMHHSKNEGR